MRPPVLSWKEHSTRPFSSPLPTRPTSSTWLPTTASSCSRSARSLAYRKAYPFLSRVILGEGVLDLEGNLPEEDMSLLAAAAGLVAQRDLHHALVPLLLGAMKEVHGGVGRLVAAGTFPSPLYVDFRSPPRRATIWRTAPHFCSATWASARRRRSIA